MAHVETHSIKISFLALLACLVAVMASAAAHAEPMAVRYLVEGKPFHKGTSVESVLTMELYEDSECTALVHSESFFAGDSSLHYEKFRPFALKGSGKAVKGLRIDAVVNPQSLGAVPYLVVKGPGVVPVASPCQVQPSVAGLMGLMGPQGTTGPQGLTGDDGSEGLAGATGSTGLQGPAGATGPQGLTGDDGSEGLMGATGAAGPQGPAGATGPQGPSGDDGSEGLTGATGVQGPAGPTGADGVGADYDYAVSEPESTTTATGYVQKLRLSTASMPAGIYRIGYSAELTNSEDDLRTEIQVQLDDATTVAEAGTGNFNSDNDYRMVGGFAVVTLSAGVHTVDLDFRVGTGGVPGDVAKIRRARVELYSVAQFGE